MWQPISDNIMTQWAKNVSPENVWPEYPRPQMTREEWQNLNGLWNFEITPRSAKSPDFAMPTTGVVGLRGQILVPFPIESALSGVKRGLSADELLWYQRTFSVPDAWRGKRVLLHFGAVDWETKVFVNDQPVGERIGGYLPFYFDITDYLLPSPSRGGDGGGVKNDLLVSVWDPTDDHWQQRGKQTNNPRTIWYTAVSGIWQTVWLEPVPQTYIAGLKITPDADSGTVRVKTNLVGPESGSGVVSVRVYEAGALIAESKTDNAAAEITVPIPNPKLWSPDSPHLYDLEVTAGEDRVGSYFGMRKFSGSGGWLCLNNKPLFQFGPLDQGYWPDGLYTPPTDEAMRRDIELVKGLGCNMLCKHVKVEPARYYYYCDRMGLIVWQDMPNGGAVVNEVALSLLTTLGFSLRDHNYRRVGRADAASREDFHRELREMVDHLHNFACIGMWVPFNEAWGQFDAKAVAKWLHEYDPSRPVDHASGWFDQGGGDCKSLHIYFRKLKPRKNRFNTKGTTPKERGQTGHEGNQSAGGRFSSLVKLRDLRVKNQRATVLSEFGGYSLNFSFR
jgi:beta-galactosidase/beta-glucuronidase